MNETALGHQVGIATVLVALLELLKRSGWFPWLSTNSALANRVVSVVAAAIVAAGITFTIMGDAAAGGAVIIKYPPLAIMVDGILHFATQIVAQEAIYQGLVKPKVV